MGEFTDPAGSARLETSSVGETLTVTGSTAASRYGPNSFTLQSIRPDENPFTGMLRLAELDGTHYSYEGQAWNIPRPPPDPKSKLGMEYIEELDPDPDLAITVRTRDELIKELGVNTYNTLISRISNHNLIQAQKCDLVLMKERVAH